MKFSGGRGGWTALFFLAACGGASEAPPLRAEVAPPATVSEPPASVPESPPTTSTPLPTPPTTPQPAARCMPQPGPLAPLFNNEQGQPRAWVPVGDALELNPERDTPQSQLGLGIAPNGTPIVAWGENLGAEWGYVVRRWDGMRWMPVGLPVFPLPAYTFSMPGRPAFAVDPLGRPVLALKEATGYESSTFRIRRWEGGTWTLLGMELQAASNALTEVTSASIAFNCSGQPVVAWGEIGPREPSVGIHVSQWTGNFWHPVGERLSAYPDGVLGDGSNGDRPSVAVDSRGFPIVAWDESARPDFISRIHVWKWDSAQWQPVAGGVASSDNGIKGNSSYMPSLVLDGADVPYLTWTQWSQTDEGSVLATPVRRAQDTQWTGVLEPGPRNGPVLAALGSRVFMLYERNDQLELQTWSDGAWLPVGEPLQALPGDTKMGEWALAVDPRGLPVVAWIEYSRNPLVTGNGGGPMDLGETQVHVWRFQ